MLIAWLSSAFAGEEVDLASAVRRAVETSEAVAMAEEAVARARADTWRVWSGALPSINGSVGYTRSFVSEFDDAFAAPEGATSAAPSTPSLDLPFGQDNTWRVGLTANQWLYTGGRLGAGLRTVGAGKRAAADGLEVAAASAALDVTRSWLDAALAERMLVIAQETAGHAEDQRARTALAHEVGRASEMEALRASVDAQNQAVAVARAVRARDAAGLRLGVALDVDGPVAPTAPLDDDDPVGLVEEALSANGLISNQDGRLAVDMADEAVVIARQGVALARAGGLPTLALTGSGGWNAYPDTLLSFDGDAWKPNVSAGFALVVPIFNGGRVVGDVLRAQADWRDAQTRRDIAGEGAAQEAADVLAERRAAEAQWAATSGTVDMARRAYAIAEMRLVEGASTALELTDARLLLETALANRAVAARDLALAVARERLLPALPVNPGGR